MAGLDPLRRAFDGTAPVASPGQNPAIRDGATGKTEGPSFGDVLQDFVKQVDDAQQGFDQAIKAVERGDVDNLHQVMLAQRKAELTLRMAAEVRNKVVEAYREVMRTQF
jgi:flagellar hook-basal body complex protein FliE